MSLLTKSWDQEAQELVNKLVKDYSTHGFIISREEASIVLNLPVSPAEDHPRWLNIKELHDEFEKNHRSIVKILQDSELKSPAPSPEADHERTRSNKPRAGSAGPSDGAPQVRRQRGNRNSQTSKAGGAGA